MLYVALKDQLIKQILDGTYSNGEVLPTEQELCDQYEMSRVTVRKALDELKKEGLVASVQGQGTVVSHRMGGFPSSLDLIALVAAVHNPFFALFVQHFERVAEENGSLVLFKQDFQGQALQSDELYFRFMKKNIRNIVFWPQSGRIDFGLLRRLRSVGMNLVFFDQMFDTGFADVVVVDNDHAVSSLYRALSTSCGDNIIFIGFHGMTLPSEISREQAFLQAGGRKDKIHTVSWGGDIETETAALLDRLAASGEMPTGLLCCNGPIGVATAKWLRNNTAIQADVALAAVDYLPEMADYSMIAYRQPMKELAEKAYQRLIAQNNQGEHWQAKVFQIQGEIVDSRLGRS